MKVIDLLNKIANGKEVPKKIKWEDIIYAYSEYDKDYLEYPFSEDEYRGLFNMKDSILTQYLNDEIEIIEDTQKEDNKIEKDDLELDNQIFKYNPTDLEILIIREMLKNRVKIKEIIDRLNGENNE